MVRIQSGSLHWTDWLHRQSVLFYLLSKPLSTTKEDGSKQHWYMIDVTIRWQSSQGGWPVQWKNVEYNGIILSDEFGCDVNFIIKSKTEPDRSGLAALVVKKTPTGDLSDDQKQLFEGTDDWF